MGILALGEVHSGPTSEGQGDPGYCSVSPAPEELRCRPGVECGYFAQAHHLHASLPEGPSSSVPQHLPPGTRGGGLGRGLTLAAHLDLPYFPRLMTDG